MSRAAVREAARLLRETVGASGMRVTLKVGDREVEMTRGEAKAKAKGSKAKKAAKEDAPLPGQKRLAFKHDALVVKVRSSELYRALRAVSLAASTDTDLPHLRAVHFAASDELVFTATDGKWMAQWTCEPEELTSAPASMLVDLSDVQRPIPLLAGDAKDVDQATINFETGVVDLTDGAVLPLRKADPALAPPYNTLWPKTRETATAHWGFSTALLTRAAKAFAVGAGEDTYVRGGFRSELDPIVLSAEKLPELRALLMPARTEPLPGAGSPS